MNSRAVLNWPDGVKDLACLVAGALLPLAYAPYDAHWIAAPLLMVLFLGCVDAAPRRALKRGWLFGLGLFGVGVSWIQISVHQFGLPILTFSISATVLFVAFVALFPAVAMWVARRWFPSSAVQQLVCTLPVAWVLGEWIRGNFLGGFPWMNIGYSQVDGPLAGFAPMVGVYGIGVLLAFSAGLLGYVLTQPRRWFWLVVIAGIYSVGVGLRTVEWTTSSGKELRVALIQGNVEQAIKWSIEEREKTLSLYAALTQPHWGSDLIVWPETAIPAFNTQVEPYLKQLQSQATAAGSDMLIGIPYRDRDSGRYFNSVISVGSDPGVYHKQHLVPFGEFMPFATLLGPLLNFLDIPMSNFSSGGAQQPLLKVAGQNVGISICYEDVFGEEVIAALPSAGLLVNVSNDAWFGDSMAPHQHLQMARMRAVESGRYMLRATNTGISAVIDAKGVVLAVAPQFQSTGLAALVRPYQGATPYARGGNLPTLLLSLGVLIVVHLRNRNAMRAADAAAS